MPDANGNDPAEELQSLRRAVSLLVATLESTTDGILVTDRSMGVLRLNQRFLEMWGIEQTDVDRGYAHAVELLFSQVQDAETSRARFKALHEHPERSSSGTIELKDGRCFERSSLPLHVDGVALGRVHNFRDVTARVRAERVQSALLQISEAAHASDDLVDLFSSIHEAVGVLLPARNLFVALYDADNDLLSFPYWVDELDAAPAPRPLASGTLSGEVIRSGKSKLVTPDTRDDLPDAVRAIVGSDSIDWLGVPLVVPGGVIGALVVQSYDGSVRYRARDMELLEFVSAQVAAAIERKRDVSERKLQAERIERLAFYDALTSLPNRALFQDRLGHALGVGRRAKRQVALLFLDLDRFKEINDSLGHGVGDLALVEVARRLQATTREGETLARLGGDEFVLVAEGASEAVAATIAQRMLDTLCQPLQLGEQQLPIGGSIGIAMYPDDGETAEELIRRTDIAMYRAKAAGGGYRFYQVDMGRMLDRQVRISSRLKLALDAGLLQLHYQPLVGLDGSGMRGAEALLRWHDEENGWVSPADFIPIAEERGMMGQLGDWVLSAACRQLLAWQGEGRPLPGRMAVNVSVKQLQDPTIVQRLETIVRSFGLAPEHFELEITESSMMADPENGLATLDALSAAGFSLAVDDFGTGYSSLSYLKRFSVDQIKIDISFVRDMLTDQDDFAIVKAIIAMAGSLGLHTTAEGVEHAEQADALAGLGCDFVQGYHFGRPVAPSEFAQLWLSQPVSPVA